MSALRGAILGALGLTLLEVLVSNDQAADNAGTLLDLTATGINHMVDPAVPLIPDRRTS